MWRNALAAALFVCAAVALLRARVGLGTAMLLLVFATQTLEPFHMFIRPQLATFVGFAFWLTALQRHWSDPHDRWIWWLPVVSCLWANLHGGFLAGLAIHSVALIAYAWRAWREPETRPAFVSAAIVGGVAGLTTLINPYGLELHLMLWDHLVPAQAVREWAPLWTAGGSLVYYLPFIPLGIALLGSRRWTPLELALVAVTAYAAISHLRHIALLSIATLILLPRPLDDALRRFLPRIAACFRSPEASRLRLAAVVAVAALMLASQAVFLRGWTRHGLRPWDIGVESLRQAPGVPLRALLVLEREQLDGNLVTDYAWAQYVLWHRFPKNPVAFDGRYRTVYPPQVEHDFLALIRADDSDPAQQRLLDDYPSELVLLPTAAPACVALARRSDWAEIYRDDQARLFAKRCAKFDEVIARAANANLREPLVSRWSTFPGGPIEAPTASRFVLNSLPARASAKP